MSAPDSDSADYEMLCEQAIEARESRDNAYWKIGEIAAAVTIRYSEKQMDDFARRINVSKRSAQQYRQVHNYYPANVRSLSPETLTWTHYREAMRLGDLNKSLALLEEAAVNVWTTDQTAVHVTEKLTDKTIPFKILDAVGKITTITKEGKIILFLDPGADLSKIPLGIVFNDESVVVKLYHQSGGAKREIGAVAPEIEGVTP